MNSSFTFEEEIDLSRFNTLYKTEPSSDAAPMNNSVPDGRYEVVVSEALLTKSQSTGNPMIRFTLRITGSTLRDRIIRKYSTITENSMPFLRKELDLCGLRLEKFDDLTSRVGELEGVALEVMQVTKGDYASIYFNRAITSRAGADGVAEDDLPF